MSKQCERKCTTIGCCNAGISFHHSISKILHSAYNILFQHGKNPVIYSRSECNYKMILISHLNYTLKAFNAVELRNISHLVQLGHAGLGNRARLVRV